MTLTAQPVAGRPLHYTVHDDALGTDALVAVSPSDDSAAGAIAVYTEAANPPASAILEARKRVAVGAMRQAIAAHEEAYIARYGRAEPLTWPELVPAVQAYESLGDGAPWDLLALLDARCGVTGETRAELCAKVTAQRATFAPEGMRISGWRARTEAAIEAATDVAGVEAAIAALRAGLAGA